MILKLPKKENQQLSKHSLEQQIEKNFKEGQQDQQYGDYPNLANQIPWQLTCEASS